MKNKKHNFCLIFLVTIFVSGCSGFYHQQYSKLKKVPATGEISAVTNNQKKHEIKSNNFPAVVKDEKVLSFHPIPNILKKDAALHFQKVKIVLRKIVAEKNYGKLNLRLKKARTTFHARVKDHHILLILACFFVAGLLFGYGIMVFLLAFVAPTILLSIVCVIGGIALFLLSLLPFLGLVSMIVGDRFQSSQKQFEEKPKRRLR